MRTYLDFEKPVAELESRVVELTALVDEQSSAPIEEELERLESKAKDALKEIFPPLADDVDRYIEKAIDHITRFSVGGLDAIIATRADTSTPEATP